MPLITETYYLSLTQDNRGILRLRCSQDDTLRTVNLKLYNNGSIFVIPSGISASVSGVKQNGAVFSKPCTISQNRESVVLQLSSDITNVDGIIVAEIVLNDGEGGRLGTSNFIIQVEKNPIRAGVVQDTETPIEYINDFIEKIQTLTARLNNLITPSGDPSLAEVVDARIGILDSTTYQTLGARLNAEFQRLSNALNGVTILESTGDTTDRTSEILSKLNTYGVCKLGKGDFYVNSLVMPEDSQLIGSGKSTRIILPSSVTDGYVVKPKSNCIIENVSFYGGFTGTHSELIASAATATRHCIILDRFNSVSSENVILNNIFINNFVGSAITQRYTIGCHCEDIIINMCYAGIDISNASYDGQCTNISMINTRYGVVQNGSNFVFTNCVSKDSAYHIMSDQQNTGCTFSSCTFSDSSLETTSILAYLSNARNGFVFDNCTFDSSLKMGLNACDGIVIKGTNFVGSDTFRIIVSNGRNTLLLITDCIADVEPTVTNAGTAARITSCYLKDGTAWSISEADIDITVDDELSDESENPVQNKVINRTISEIKADLDSLDESLDESLDKLTDVTTISKVGMLNASISGNPLKINNASYARIVYGLVNEANSITVTKNAGRVFNVGFTSEVPTNGTSLLSSVIDHTGETITAEVPEGANYVVIYCYNSNIDTGTAEDMVNSVIITGNFGAKDVIVREYIDSHSTDIENSEGFMSEMTYRREKINLFNGVLTQGYTAANGTQYPSTTGYIQTEKIDVHELIGETIKVWNEGTQRYIRFVCAYGKTELPLETLGTNTNGLTYTIPDGVYYVVLSFAKTQFVTNDILITVSDYTIYEPSTTEWVINGYDAVTGAINIPVPVQLSSESLANNQRIVGTANSVKRLGSYVFYCKPGELTEDNYIIFGKDSNKGYAVGISSTNLAWFKNDSNIGSVTHGLTISDYLFVTVNKIPGTGAVVNVYTNGGHYTRTNTSWTDDHGAPYVYNNSGETITDVKMTWSSSAFRNRNWIFGDSYVSIAETRWPKYVYDLGFGENLMLNGYPGEQTAAGYADLINCLKQGKPSVMAWCLGMNDADNGEINSSWLSHTQAFLRVCRLYDITPILATIPCCPIANHSYKNAWVRASGYRYIDFASAVNVEQDSTTWFDGMLHTDNIHPTAQGAIALATQVLTDYPELLAK